MCACESSARSGRANSSLGSAGATSRRMPIVSDRKSPIRRLKTGSVRMVNDRRSSEHSGVPSHAAKKPTSGQSSGCGRCAPPPPDVFAHTHTVQRGKEVRAGPLPRSHFNRGEMARGISAMRRLHSRTRVYGVSSCAYSPKPRAAWIWPAPLSTSGLCTCSTAMW